jgi:hypothetical protein
VILQQSLKHSLKGRVHQRREIVVVASRSGAAGGRCTTSDWMDVLPVMEYISTILTTCVRRWMRVTIRTTNVHAERVNPSL